MYQTHRASAPLSSRGSTSLFFFQTQMHTEYLEIHKSITTSQAFLSACNHYISLSYDQLIFFQVRSSIQHNTICRSILKYRPNLFPLHKSHCFSFLMLRRAHPASGGIRLLSMNKLFKYLTTNNLCSPPKESPKEHFVPLDLSK